MKIKAYILDSQKEKNSECFLCRMTLEDYITGLPLTYQNYEIQREIVANVYLDHLVETVLNYNHIPPIVLVVGTKGYLKTGEELSISSFKILDGLQRTFRLKAIYDTIQFCINELGKDDKYLAWSKLKLSREFSDRLMELNSNTEILRKILEAYHQEGEDPLLDKYRNNKQWFEIWSGLSPEQEVKKMLMLNAGHKPVKARHQLELLFLNLLPILRRGKKDDFKLYREKEISATQFSKKRKCGSFHFAHIIAGLLSLYEGEPVTPSSDLIQSIQSADHGIDEYGELTDPSFLEYFISFLLKLDQLLQDQYKELGTLWMGREVSMAGLCGAIGYRAKEINSDRKSVMQQVLKILKDHPRALNLIEYENVRNNLDLSKINIGNVNRRAIYRAILNMIDNSGIKAVKWENHFRLEGK